MYFEDRSMYQLSNVSRKFTETIEYIYGTYCSNQVSNLYNYLENSNSISCLLLSIDGKYK